MLHRTFGVSVLGLVLAGCASSSMQDLGGKASPDLNDMDNNFYKIIAEANLTEIQTSQMAQSQAGDQSVKDFAQRMINDHTTAQAELSELAAQKHVTLPTKLDDEHQAIVDELKGKLGAPFDHAYVDVQVTAHKETIAADQNEADNGTDPETKSLAGRLLDTLKMHLSMAQKLQGGSM